MPETDFDFSTSDSEFYGYIKVVDDIASVDMESVRTEIGSFETLVYPAAWFDGAASGSCCRQEDY
jgi:hypothetical protein